MPKVTLTWYPEKNQWHMDNTVGRFIQEFFDCDNMHLYFPELDKNKPNVYEVNIRKIE